MSDLISRQDAVSREAVSEWLKQYGQDVLHGKYKFSLMYIWKNLMDLPSAQLKIGKWIERGDEWDGVYYECSACKEPFVLIDGTPSDNLYNYCPNCGARMLKEGEEQNESKILD